MILFVSFAPIQFMGGAEKWISNISEQIAKQEEVQIINVSPSVANIYSQIVLARKFENRVDNSKFNLANLTQLGMNGLIPFTPKWKTAKDIFKKSRIIYIKFEVIEVFLVLYFLGLSGLKKTIAGLHTAFIYNDPKSFFDRLHKLFYESFFSKYFLSKVKVIHVINKRDQKFIENNFSLKNIVYIPNGINPPISEVKKHYSYSKKSLNVIFVGELSVRKGVDILIDLIKKSPKNFHFQIAGNGTMKKDIQLLSKKHPNCEYLGYIENSKLSKYYFKSDVLFLPSKAEGMSLVILEGMAHGLEIVDSKNTSLDLPKFIEHSNQSLEVNEYLEILKHLYENKENNYKNKKRIQQYFFKNFSNKIILKKLLKTIFNINLNTKKNIYA